ncbi:hypothetical protein [Haladaptatus caseinilyticus]|uniref:hypothetical protein n=1 Tax=Haladaptatus caseinilyticus TaxID=2993314 RepID=UPI00224A666D|nr:hypothetical protein [Haladaptatus caseinilyticus]
MAENNSTNVDQTTRRTALKRIGTVGVSLAGIGSMADSTAAATSIGITKGDSSKSGSGNTRVGSYARPNDNEMGALANASGIGNGSATARLYGRFNPSSNGSYDVTAEYYRAGRTYTGGSGSATADISLFVRGDGQGIKRDQVESPSGKTVGTTTQTAGFELSGSTTYDVGVEIKVSCDEPFGAGSVADFFNNLPTQSPNNRCVEVNRLNISSL